MRRRHRLRLGIVLVASASVHAGCGLEDLHLDLRFDGQTEEIGPVFVDRELVVVNVPEGVAWPRGDHYYRSLWLDPATESTTVVPILDGQVLLRRRGRFVTPRDPHEPPLRPGTSHTPGRGRLDASWDAATAQWVFTATPLTTGTLEIPTAPVLLRPSPGTDHVGRDSLRATWRAPGFESPGRVWLVVAAPDTAWSVGRFYPGPDSMSIGLPAIAPTDAVLAAVLQSGNSFEDPARPLHDQVFGMAVVVWSEPVPIRVGASGVGSVPAPRRSGTTSGCAEDGGPRGPKSGHR